MSSVDLGFYELATTRHGIRHFRVPAMSIILPKLRKRYFDVLIACASMDKDTDPFLKKVGSENTEYLVHFGTQSHPMSAIAYLSLNNRELRHFHVEVFRRKMLKERVPSDNQTLLTETQFKEIISLAIGHGAIVDINCDFCVPLKELPDNSLIKSASIDLKVANMSFRTAASEIEITGGPVRRVRWRMQGFDSSAKVRIGMNAQLKGIIDRSYLSRFERYMYTLFTSLFLETETLIEDQEK